MKVTLQDVEHVAGLANLELTEEERTRMLKDLNSILQYIDRLNQLDTSNVPPMAQTVDRYGVDAKTGSARYAYATRADALGPCIPRETAMQNAPETDGALFKVPKVIEK